MNKAPEKMTVMHLEVLVMPNGEIICMGDSVGWIERIGKFLSEPEIKK